MNSSLFNPMRKMESMLEAVDYVSPIVSSARFITPSKLMCSASKTPTVFKSTLLSQRAKGPVAYTAYANVSTRCDRTPSNSKLISARHQFIACRPCNDSKLKSARQEPIS